jgi:hypothetical protein
MRRDDLAGHDIRPESAGFEILYRRLYRRFTLIASMNHNAISLALNIVEAPEECVQG